jgi:hypothetical protein
VGEPSRQDIERRGKLEKDSARELDVHGFLFRYSTHDAWTDGKQGRVAKSRAGRRGLRNGQRDSTVNDVTTNDGERRGRRRDWESKPSEKIRARD